MKRIGKAIALTAAILAVMWLAFLGLVYNKMTSSTEEFGMFMSNMPMPGYFVLPFETLWMRARVGTIHVGDTAPDFKLSLVDKSGDVQLSSFRGSKPVVLI